MTTIMIYMMRMGLGISVLLLLLGHLKKIRHMQKWIVIGLAIIWGVYFWAYQTAKFDYPAKILENIIIARLENPESYSRAESRVLREGITDIYVQIKFSYKNKGQFTEHSQVIMALMNPILYAIKHNRLSESELEHLKNEFEMQKKEGKELDPRYAKVEAFEVNGKPRPDAEVKKINATLINSKHSSYPFAAPDF